MLSSLLFTLSNGIFFNPPGFQLPSKISQISCCLTHEGLYNNKNLDTVQRSHSIGLRLRNPHQEHNASGVRESTHESGHRLLKRHKQYNMQCATHNDNAYSVTVSNGPVRSLITELSLYIKCIMIKSKKPTELITELICTALLGDCIK